MRFRDFLCESVVDAWNNLNNLAARGRLDKNEMMILADNLQDHAENQEDWEIADIIRKMGQHDLYPGVFGNARRMGWSNVRFASPNQWGPMRRRKNGLAPWVVTRESIQHLARVPGAVPQGASDVIDVYFDTAQEAIMAMVNFIRQAPWGFLAAVPEEETRKFRPYNSDVISSIYWIIAYKNALENFSQEHNVNHLSAFSNALYEIDVFLSYIRRLDDVDNISGVRDVRQMLEQAQEIVQKALKVNRNELTPDQMEVWRELIKLKRTLERLLK